MFSSCPIAAIPIASLPSVSGAATRFPQPIYGFWHSARKRRRHIPRQPSVEQEIERALADLKQHDAAAIERALARILAATAMLRRQRQLRSLLETKILETKILSARRAAELAQDEQDINDLLGKL